MDQETKDSVRALFAKYMALGFTTLDIEYGGSGDDGGIESQAMTDADECVRNDYHNKLELKDEEADLANDLGYHILDKTGLEGYGNNEGGQGHIFIDLTSGKVEVEHEWNVITTESESCNLGLFTEEEAEEEAEETIEA